MFDYPLRAMDALSKLGFVEAAVCMLSYARARAFPIKRPRNFQQWVTNQFGKRLFEIFFKTYTEKVWGTKCTEISADWAAQRIKGLSLGSAVWHSLRPQKKKERSQAIKTLIDSFRYPRRGPGMMWEAAADKVRANGGKVLLGWEVEKVELDRVSGRWSIIAADSLNHEKQRFVADHVISSISIRELVASLAPKPGEDLRRAAETLRYRDFLVVALVIRERGLFDDNWIYIHEPTVKVGRIQNFKSWSPEMVPDQSLNCYGMEYFCFENDGLWSMQDSELIDLARKEIMQLGLVEENDVIEGCVVRQRKAYPVYDDDYQTHVETVRNALKEDYPSLHLVGRNGMHKYNNQDHAMMTAMLCVENILAETKLYDLWQVNGDAEYHEAGEAIAEQKGTALRHVPTRIPATPELASRQS